MSGVGDYFDGIASCEHVCFFFRSLKGYAIVCGGIFGVIQEYRHLMSELYRQGCVVF